MDLLAHIKRLMIRGSYVLTQKAAMECERDGLEEEDVIEAVVNAVTLRSKRSKSSNKRVPGEKVHIIEGFTFDGVLVYTKGVIRKHDNREVFYLLVSAKRSTLGEQE